MSSDRGRDAKSPGEIPVRGLRDVFWRVIEAITADRVTLIAAGVTYYLLLSLFPALAALVALYGFVADPQQLWDTLASGKCLSTWIVRPHTQSVDCSYTAKGFHAEFCVLCRPRCSDLECQQWHEGDIRCYERCISGKGETELCTPEPLISDIYIRWAYYRHRSYRGHRSASSRFVISLAGSMAGALARFARWPLVLVLVGCGIALIYRFGPSRAQAKFRWLNWGVVLSTLLWMSASILFSFYIENFANYNATYGTLGALIGMMVWVWISVIILIVGAELNAELEHQTACDSTTGSPQPMGNRGAFVADTLGKTVD